MLIMFPPLGRRWPKRAPRHSRIRRPTGEAPPRDEDLQRRWLPEATRHEPLTYVILDCILTCPTDTLIVWTEPSNGVDMALSFQEGEGCAMIWSVLPSSLCANMLNRHLTDMRRRKFVNNVQQTFQSAIGPGLFRPYDPELTLADNTHR